MTREQLKQLAKDLTAEEVREIAMIQIQESIREELAALTQDQGPEKAGS